MDNHDYYIDQIKRLERITEHIRLDLDEAKKGQPAFNWIIVFMIVSGMYTLAG